MFQIVRPPGHFVRARIDEHGERIPLTIADFDACHGTVTVVIQSRLKRSRGSRSCIKGRSKWSGARDHFRGLASECPAGRENELCRESAAEEDGHLAMWETELEQRA